MFYSDLVKKACRISFEAHKNDVDKGGYPYVYHPFFLASQFNDEACVCVALLHDVMEDHGDEFTEEAYREFFLDEGTNLHVAFDQKGNMIGMIETNGERCGLIGLPSVNVGEVFVKREWRGKGVSASLLSYAYEYERKRSVTTLWVEHGTANPNARAFWGNYFETFEYEMDRIIRK